jgi:signal transduction histidine kinase
MGKGSMDALIYFGSLVACALLVSVLASVGLKKRQEPCVSLFIWLCLCVLFLSLAEIASLLAPTSSQALFWFRFRYPFAAGGSVFWLLFALDYTGIEVKKGPRAALLVIPLATQALLWSNHLHGLWVEQEPILRRIGAFWIAETWTRIPAAGYLLHSFYSLVLIFSGGLLLVVKAWRGEGGGGQRAVLLTAAALCATAALALPSFGITKGITFNPVTPGVSLYLGLTGAAILPAHSRKLSLPEGSFTFPGGIRLHRGPMPIFILLFMIIVAATGSAAILSLRDYKEGFKAEVEKELSSITRLKIDELEGWRSDRIADASLFHNNKAFGMLVERLSSDPSALSEVMAWLEAVFDKRHYYGVFLLDEQGLVKASFPEWVRETQTPPADEMKGLMSRGDISFLDLRRQGGHDPIHLGILAPISTGETATAAVLLRIDPTLFFFRLLARWPVPRKSPETLLVKREGDHALFLNDVRFMASSALNVKMPLKRRDAPYVRAVLGERGIMEGVDYRGIPVIACVEEVPHTGWLMVAKMDASEALGPLKERLWQTWAFFGAILIACGAVFAVILRTEALRNYRELARSAEVAIKAEQVIRRLNLELEERVRQRTAQLEAANRELEAFSYSVSHDLRAPLRAIEGFTSALLKGYRAALDEKALHYLTRINEGSNNMKRMIEALLSLSRISRADIRSQIVDMTGLAAGIADELRKAQEKRSVEVKIDPGMTAYADPRLARIVLQNLLENAFKFTRTRPHALIHVGMTGKDGVKRFFVKDDGVGFNQAHSDRLFVPFQRLHSEEEFPGTGIGLATVQRIVNRHGGLLLAESETGKGATFYFTFGG